MSATRVAFAAVAAFGTLATARATAQDAKVPILTVPFTMADEHMLVEARVDDDDAPLRFVFDTGASGTVLDEAVARRLHIEATGSHDATGASGSVQLRVAAGRRLRLADGAVLSDLAMVLTDLTHLSAEFDRPLAGIVGNDLLRRWLTEIDFTAGELRLHSFDDELPTDGWQEIAFTFGRGIRIPQFEVAVVFADGERLAGPVLFDSGAACALIVNQPFAEANRVAARAGRTVEHRSQTLTAPIVMLTALAGSLQVGGTQWRDVPVEIATGKQGVTGYAGYLGILDNNVIRRFDWIVDYRRKRLFCKPNAAGATPFQRPTIGASFELHDGAITVTQVVADSPAAVAGLREGDRVVAIDDRALGGATPATGKDVVALRKYLEQEGKVVKVAVERDGGRRTLEWTVRSLL